MNNEEFREKIKRTVKKAIDDKLDLDGLVNVLKKILYYEISGFSQKIAESIKVHDPPDMALIAYKGRHYFKMGYDRRDMEVNEFMRNWVINNIIREVRMENRTIEGRKLSESTTPPPSIITAEESGGEVKTEAVTIS